MVGAVIYVRVSDPRQAENLSLNTQLKACEEYCQRQGYEVLARFREEGESAKTADRTELQNLLKFCRTHKGQVQFLVVYNLTRFAREKYDHFALRSHLKSFGISLRSATEPIDDTSTGKLMEGVLAAFAQFDNDVRSDRTRAGMRAALELGRWVFAPPLGYLPGNRRRSEPSMILDPDRAPLVRRAFEEVASGQHTKQDVLRLVTRLGLRTRTGAELSPQSFNQMLRKPVYAGVIDSPDFGVARKGDFEPLVSEAVFYRAQGVSRGIVPVTAPRVRNRPEFPLRNFVRCTSCGKPLTGSFSTGNGGKYAYYHCRLPCRVVNIAIAKLEGAFFEELRRLQPTAGYMKLVKERVLQIWRDKQAEIRQEAIDMQAKAETIQKKLDRLGHAFIFAESIDEATYERQRDKLREQQLLAGIDRHAVELEKLDVEGILAFAEQLLPSAANVWSQASLDQKQRLQSLFFPEGIAFDGKSFSRTNLTSSAFRYLEPVSGGNDGLVSPEGIVPTRDEPKASRGVPENFRGEIKPSEARIGDPNVRQLEPHQRLARQIGQFAGCSVKAAISLRNNGFLLF